MTRTQTIRDFAYLIIPNCFRVWIDFGFGFVVLDSEYLHRNLNHSKSKLIKTNSYLIFRFSLGTGVGASSDSISVSIESNCEPGHEREISDDVMLSLDLYP